MNAPPKRKRHGVSDMAPSRLLQRSKTTPEIPNAQAKVEGFQHALAALDNLPLPTGSTATELLDTCKFAQAFCEKVFKKARELLRREPGAIPNWAISEIPQRTLSKDTLRIFDALSRADLLDAEEFMAACSTSLTALPSALAERNPHWSVDEIEHVLNRALSDLISFEKVIRLSRFKSRQIELSL
jgi:hypothetical protein